MHASLAAAAVLLIVSAPPQRELSSLRRFTRATLFVRNRYAEPARVDPRAMIREAVLRLAREYPQVQATFSDSGMEVTASGKTQTFPLARIDSLWKMAFAMKDVADFIER